MIWFAAMMMAAQATSGATGGNRRSPTCPRSDGTAEAGVVDLQLQERGSSPECTDKSAGEKANSAHSDSPIASPADRRPWSVGAILRGWSFG